MYVKKKQKGKTEGKGLRIPRNKISEEKYTNC